MVLPVLVLAKWSTVPCQAAPRTGLCSWTSTVPATLIFAIILNVRSLFVFCFLNLLQSSLFNFQNKHTSFRLHFCNQLLSHSNICNLSLALLKNADCTLCFLNHSGSFAFSI